MELFYKSREISDEFDYLLEKIFQKPQKWLTSRRLIGNGVKFLENFGENRLEFEEEF